MNLSPAPALAFKVAIAALLLVGCQPSDDRIVSAPRQKIEVLDGDTLIFEGQVLRIRGIDAPEVGPWAKCWAEAALGGASRNELESLLKGQRDKTWKLSNPSQPDARGSITANLVTDRGDDVSDSMIVYGYAAKTDGTWNWCGTDQSLHDPLQNEPSPHGPNLWWPSGQMFDKRAAD
jgi:endonuclease YncB( thermonuclease family)